MLQAATPITVSTAGLSVEDLYRVAVEEAPVEIAVDVWERIMAGRAVVERVLASDRLVYGLNSQLGHLRDERIAPDALMAYQVSLVIGHAGGVGAPLPDEDVRAMIVARVAGIVQGGSGVHPDALRTLMAMLNARVHPIVPEVGSVGASDLMHMAAVAMVMIGRGEARFQGEMLPGAEALARAGIAPYVPRPLDGLALVSANGASLGGGALAVLDAERIAALADTAGALALEVITGNPSPYEALAAAAKPVPGQIAAAAHIREALAGSYLYDTATTRSVQDPLSFRVMPQVHGALREQIGAARQSVELELNARNDNPLVSIEEDRIVSTGNFHPMLLALNFEALRLGLAHVGMLAERRMNKVLATRAHDPDAFFTAAAGAKHYAVGAALAYSAAALLSELKHLAAPVTLGCPPLDLDVEDHATLAPLAVTLTRRALRHLETILVIELLLCADMLDAMASVPRLGAGTRAVYEITRNAVAATAEHASATVTVDTVRQQLRAQGG